MTEGSKLSLFLLRIGIGWVFFYAGWSKVITYFTDAKDWTAAGFLGHLEGPFGDFFAGLAGNTVIDYLNAYGLLLIGIAILLGVLVRWSSFWGILLMVLYYLAGYPPENSFIVDEHIIYSLVLIALAGLGAGRVWGLDGMLEKTFATSNRWALKLLG